MITAEAVNVVEVPCDPVLTQACAHYYSAIFVEKRQDKFTCSASNKRRDGDATADWTRQHTDRDWWAFTASEFPNPYYELRADGLHKPRLPPKDEHGSRAVKPKEIAPKCEADEWPPAYFMPDDKKLHTGKMGQLVRWIPKSHNGRAGQLWGGFCKKYDGNIGNGQRLRARKVYSETIPGVTNAKGNPKYRSWTEDDESYHTVGFNNGKEWDFLNGKNRWVRTAGKKLLQLEGKATSHDGHGLDGKKTTTYIWDRATFTRGVFSLVFDKYQNPKKGVKVKPLPSKENNFYLDENPCWPKDIVPDDPGFVLLNNDNWYKEYNKKDAAAKYVNDYRAAPPKALLDAAIQRRGHDPRDDAPAPDDSQPDEDDDSSQKRRSERLDLIEERLVLRDESMNVTRPLSDEEILHQVQIIECADRECSRERADLEGYDDDSLFVRGAALPATPSANSAIPTLISSTSVTDMSTNKRTPLSADLPLITPYVKGF